MGIDLKMQTKGAWPNIWWEFWKHNIPVSILQSLLADQVYCALMVTPGVLVPCHRRWSPKQGKFHHRNQARGETAYGKLQKNWVSRLNYIYKGIWQIHSLRPLSWVNHASLKGGKEPLFCDKKIVKFVLSLLWFSLIFFRCKQIHKLSSCENCVLLIYK